MLAIWLELAGRRAHCVPSSQIASFAAAMSVPATNSYPGRVPHPSASRSSLTVLHVS